VISFNTKTEDPENIEINTWKYYKNGIIAPINSIGSSLYKLWSKSNFHTA